MDIKELEEYIKSFFGYKLSSILSNSEEAIDISLYDSYVVTFGFNKESSLFYGKLHLPESFTSSYFLGFKCVNIKNNEEDIKNALEKVDEYCRARLTPSFIKVYEESFIANTHKEE